MIVGLTGGVGSGKTTVAQFFRELNVPVLDSDQITRDLMKPGQASYQEIIQHFGKEILQKDGSINRRALREHIFQSLEDRTWLEQLLHPQVIEIIQQQAKLIPKGQYLMIEIPLLIEANFQEGVDRILVVDCPEDLQIERIKSRDKMKDEHVINMLNAQVSRSQRREHADDIILNEGSIENLKKKVAELHQKYRALITA